MKTKLLNTLLVISFVATTIFGCSIKNIKATDMSNANTKNTVVAINKNILKEPKISTANLMEKFEKRKKEAQDTVKRAISSSKTKKAEVNKKPETIQEKIKTSCEQYNVDYDIALAIARLETGHFKSYAYRVGNNPGGLSRNEKPMKFASKDEGVDRFVRNLKVGYFDKGLDTVQEIGRKYCPVNPNWSNLVEQIMKMD